VGYKLARLEIDHADSANACARLQRSRGVALMGCSVCVWRDSEIRTAVGTSRCWMSLRGAKGLWSVQVRAHMHIQLCVQLNFMMFKCMQILAFSVQLLPVIIPCNSGTIRQNTSLSRISM
jgi:hypothetical protein